MAGPQSKGALYTAIEKLAKEGPIQDMLAESEPTRKERRQTWKELCRQAKEKNKDRFRDYQAGQSFNLDKIAWIWSGDENALEGLKLIIEGESFEYNASSELAKTLDSALDDPQLTELVEIMGTFITEPVLKILENELVNPSSDPKEFARAFHGILTSITTVSGVMDTIAQATSIGAIKSVGQMFQSVYWNMGLGFLGWQTMSPLLEYGLKPNMDRYYKRLSRFQRFNAAESRDLFALGKITREQMIDTLREDGWRDEDIDYWLSLAYRNLSEADVWDLNSQGLIDDTELVIRLRAIGYDPKDIPLVIALHDSDAQKEATEVSLSTARSSFKKDLITEAEYRALLTSLGKSVQEISLLVQLDAASKETEARDLTVGQIKAALNNAVIVETEARHQLALLGFESGSVDILIDTWKKELIPSFARLNRSTILQAYQFGVITRQTAFTRLQEVGFNADDADLQLRLLEARNPEVLLPGNYTTSKVLTPSVLTSLVVSGLLSTEEMTSRLVAAGYSEDDSQLLTDMASLKREREKTPINQVTIERAYISGVLSRTQSYTHLLDLGFEADAAETILATAERENIAVFYPDLATVTRLPTITALVKAYNNGIVTSSEYYARAAEIGFSSDDAKMYLLLSETAGSEKAKTLSQAQIVNAYGAKIFTRIQALDRLVDLGYGTDDAIILLRMERPLVTETDYWTQMISGQLTVDSVISALLSDGFTWQEIIDAFTILSEAAYAALGVDKAALIAAMQQTMQENLQGGE